MDLTRNCLECGKPFIGRSDKKFCTDACRNAKNNRNRTAATNRMRAINCILNKNRKILEQHFPNGCDNATTSKSMLIERGFNFNYITSFAAEKKGTARYYCYEYAYTVSESDQVMVVRNKE